MLEQKAAQRNQSAQLASTAVGELCPACGLCCNGVLFGDIELQPGDDRKPLREAGIPLIRKGRKTCLAHPCAAFDGSRCRVYDDRPSRCRSFECRLLQRRLANEVTRPDALRAIRLARRQADQVRALARELGCRDESLPLNRRYARIMSEPEDLANHERSRLRGKLIAAVYRLVRTLEGHFLD